MSLNILPFKPKNKAHHLTRLLQILHGQGWLKAKQLEELCPTLKPRTVRELVEISGGQIISCTSKGYRLTVEATPDEVRHAMNDLRSRARKLDKRYVETSKVWHKAAHHSAS